MYDLHAHILPGVDDGAATLNEAVDMARVAVEHGTKTILATPHRRDVAENSSVSEVQDIQRRLSGELESSGIELDLLLGMENHLDLDLPEDLSTGHALPINGTRYVLVELPFFGYPNYVEEILFQLQLQGSTPVLAHPERIEAIQRNPGRLAEFVDRGMLTQITAGSILGHFGGGVKRFTLSLLRKGLVHIIASDTHAPTGNRSPALPSGVAKAASIVGEERARAMVVDTPMAILNGQTVEIESRREIRGARRWWHPWRS
jgi:protein-tyrosine phosphatase